MARVSILVVCVLLLEGCAWFRAQLWRAGFTGESAEVTAVAKRDRYLDATLMLEEGSARFFFPSSYDCTQIIKAGSTVEVGDIGVLPAVRIGEKRCDPVGLLSLEQWVVRYRRALTPAEREADVQFEVGYRDDDMVFARGDFRFAHFSAIRERQGGGAGYTDDYTIRRNVPVIAVLPNVPDCQSAIAAGQARAVFADEGPPYTLISGDDRCEVLGLVLVFQTKGALQGGQVEPTR